MNIEAKEFQLTLTHGELWSIAFDVRRALEHSLENHWVSYQDVWKDRENERLIVIKNMFYALGRPDLYNEIYNKADQIFKDYNLSKEK